MSVSHKNSSTLGDHDFYHAPAMYGIVRMLNKWRVTLSRRGHKFLRDFAFSRYGGESAALACAQAYRDEVVRQHLPQERREVAQKLLPSNKSGVAGVTFRSNRKGEITSWHAITRVSVDRVLTKSFGVGRYGAAQAELLAIAERERQLAQMRGLRKVHPAEQGVRAMVQKAPTTSKATANGAQRTLPEPIAVVEILRKNNSSGIPGVSCIMNADGSPRYWLAKTGGIGRRSISQSFSVKTHGNEKARLLAIAARKEQLQLKEASHTRIQKSG
ncbi:AP2/ERF family transcription factor [Variovorax sp. YR566]|uniref:AP2/ERF family transcription factor n=1 Tax=Variovorax sp. YR566 TaxID=3450237 RepID=UPI003F813402